MPHNSESHRATSTCSVFVRPWVSNTMVHATRSSLSEMLREEHRMLTASQGPRCRVWTLNFRAGPLQRLRRSLVRIGCRACSLGALCRCRPASRGGLPARSWLTVIVQDLVVRDGARVLDNRPAHRVDPVLLFLAPQASCKSTRDTVIGALLPAQVPAEEVDPAPQIAREVATLSAALDNEIPTDLIAVSNEEQRLRTGREAQRRRGD